MISNSEGSSGQVALLHAPPSTPITTQKTLQRLCARTQPPCLPPASLSTGRSWHGDTLAQPGWQRTAMLSQLKGGRRIGGINPASLEGTRWTENRRRDGGRE